MKARCVPLEGHPKKILGLPLSHHVLAPSLVTWLLPGRVNTQGSFSPTHLSLTGQGPFQGYCHLGVWKFPYWLRAPMHLPGS